MEKVTDEMMDKLSVLAALEIDDSQKDIIKNDLKKMIEYIEIIRTADIEEKSIGDDKVDYHMTLIDSRDNVLRKDEEYITPMYESTKIIESAPQKEGAYVVVPKTT